MQGRARGQGMGGVGAWLGTSSAVNHCREPRAGGKLQYIGGAGDKLLFAA